MDRIQLLFLVTSKTSGMFLKFIYDSYFESAPRLIARFIEIPRNSRQLKTLIIDDAKFNELKKMSLGEVVANGFYVCLIESMSLSLLKFSYKKKSESELKEFLLLRISILTFIFLIRNKYFNALIVYYLDGSSQWLLF